MIFKEDGTEVTLTITEYGELKGSIRAVEAEAKSRIAKANEIANTAEKLLSEAINKEALSRQLNDLIESNQRKEEIMARTVRMAEHVMQEVYHTFANVSRTNRSELQEKMKSLRG